MQADHETTTVMLEQGLACQAINFSSLYLFPLLHMYLLQQGNSNSIQVSTSQKLLHERVEITKGKFLSVVAMRPTDDGPRGGGAIMSEQNIWSDNGLAAGLDIGLIRLRHCGLLLGCAFE
jgi:hypothetical protein